MASSKNLPDALAEETQWIARAQKGDRSAFASLVERYWDRLYRWIYQLGHDSHIAEDLTQETFLKALAHLTKFKLGTKFGAWLFRIAHNAFANHCRSTARRRDALPEDLEGRDGGPLAAAVTRESLAGLANALGRVPTDYRAALLLRVEEDLSFKEIAAVLNLTEETARWRVFKARQKLLELLAPDRKWRSHELPSHPTSIARPGKPRSADRADRRPSRGLPVLSRLAAPAPGRRTAAAFDSGSTEPGTGPVPSAAMGAGACASRRARFSRSQPVSPPGTVRRTNGLVRNLPSPLPWRRP